MAQDFIIPTNSGTVPQTTCVSSYFSSATFTPQGAIRGNSMLAATVQPVLENTQGEATLYSPDYISSDLITLQIGPIDTPPQSGSFNMGVLAGAILSVSTSGSYPIQTAATNYLATGNTVKIVGSTTTPSIDGTYSVTRVDSTHFTCTGIPVVTGSGAGGNIYLLNGTSGSNLIGLAYNITAAALQTVLNLALAQLSLPLANVTMLNTGIYQFIGQTNGTIATGTFFADPTYLYPQCGWAANEQTLGSSTSPYVVNLVLEQSAFCYSQFTTPLPGTGITVSTLQAGGGGANQIQQLTFNQPNTYGGGYTLSLTALAAGGIFQAAGNLGTGTIQTILPHNLTTGDVVNIAGGTVLDQNGYVVTVVGAYRFTVSTSAVGNSGQVGYFCAQARIYTATCGIATPGMTAAQLGAVLSNHPSIFYSNPNGYPDDVIITVNGYLSWTAQFTGILGNSSAQVLAVPSDTLIGPQGFSGTLNYNTVQLYNFSLTQSGFSFTVPFTISRTRATGEKRTILYLDAYTIWKDNLNAATAVPVGMPGVVTYNTATGALLTPTAIVFFNANLATWLASLPLSPPGGGGWWNNGGSPTYA